MDKYVIEIHNSNPKLLKYWRYQFIDKLFLSLISAFTKIHQIEEAYESIKEFTNYLTLSKDQSYSIIELLGFFVEVIQLQEVFYVFSLFQK